MFPVVAELKAFADGQEAVVDREHSPPVLALSRRVVDHKCLGGFINGGKARTVRRKRNGTNRLGEVVNDLPIPRFDNESLSRYDNSLAGMNRQASTRDGFMKVAGRDIDWEQADADRLIADDASQRLR